jgi:hypothetical protein
MRRPGAALGAEVEGGALAPDPGPAIAAASRVTVLRHEVGVSWHRSMGGAMGGGSPGAWGARTTFGIAPDAGVFPGRDPAR